MNLLSSMDLSRDSIEEIFGIADELSAGKEELALQSRSTIALLFEEPSTRTRVSFEVAAAQLGCTPIYIDVGTSQISRGEALADTAKVLSSYCDFIAVRMKSDEELSIIARNSTVPVINALTLLEHPTQALADCYTIRSHKGRSLKGIRIAFMGDIAQNTANSLMMTAVQLGASVALLGPKGTAPNPLYYNKARGYGDVRVYDSIEEGLSGADVVYTDTFVSMGDESEAAQRKERFSHYILDADALSLSKRDSIVMHPLPAHRGEEISADVIDGPRSAVWEQAANKLLLEKAVLLYLSERK